MDIEFNLINEFIYNYFTKLITTKTEKEIMLIYTTFGTLEKMVHDPNNKDFNLLELFEKYNVIKPRANDIYILYNLLISYPILVCPLTGNKITKYEYYNLFIKKKIEICFNNSNNKNFFKELIDIIKPNKLNPYQLFVKEHMSILIKRENNKDKNKLSRNDLMKEISELWKKHKEVLITPLLVNPDVNNKQIKKKKNISATIKRLVWNTNIGEEIGKAKCLCCKSTDITQLSFNCGHIIAEANGGETIVSNLKPICQNCNSSMGTKNLNDFIKLFK